MTGLKMRRWVWGAIATFFCTELIPPQKALGKESSWTNHSNGSSQATKADDSSNVLTITLPLRNSSRGEEKVELTVDTKGLEKANVTLEQIKASHLEKDNEDEYYISVNGIRYYVETKVHQMIKLLGNDGNPDVTIDLTKLKGRTLKDAADDPTLLPLEPMQINWSRPLKCHMKSLLINITANSIELKINDINKANYKVDSEKHRGQIAHVRDEGLLLVVVNPYTCNLTMEYLSATSDIGGYRDLLWGLESIAYGKLIFVASLRDGASFITRKTRNTFKMLGSLWAKFYLYRDSWFMLFVKGGKVFHDTLIPNLGQLNCSGSPLVFHFDTEHLVMNETNECISWPSRERWEARKLFCQTHDGFDNLCHCDHPLDFRSREAGTESLPTTTMTTESNNTTADANPPIPLLIIMSKKVRHLFHLLQSLVLQPNLTREDILLISDGHYERTAQLAYILGLKLLVHRHEGSGSAVISANLRFALFQGLNLFPEAENFIVLEDDLLLAPDFYSYMNQMSSIFKMDKSIYTVNAFNHLSFPHTSSDPTLTYRVKCYPAYGWMMPKYMIEEILILWLPSNVAHDWDYYLGSDIVSKKKDCVVPDINRSYHWSTKGFHNTASYMTDKLYLSRNMNKDPDTILQPLDRLLKENYDIEMTSLLNRSIPISLKTDQNLRDVILEPGNIYTIFVSQNKANDASSFRLFADDMGIWTMDLRDHYNYAWRFPYKNATLLVIGVPKSPYRSYMPKNYLLITGNNETDWEIGLGEYFFRSQTKFYTHRNNLFLPKWDKL